MSYNLLNIEDFTPQNINFDLPNNKNGNICCNNILYNIYQTPKLVNKSKVYTKNDESYIDVLVTDKSFAKFLSNVDKTVKLETSNKNGVWFRKEIPKETLDKYYTPIIQTVNKEKYLSIKITDKSKIYDENNELLNKENINELDNVILLITLDSIIFEKDNYYLNIIGNHIKVYKQKISLTDMIKTNNVLDNDIINHLASNNNEYDEYDDSDEEDDEEDYEDDEEEDDNLDDYEISSRMIINKRKELSNKYKEAENASINAHNLRQQAIDLAQELEDYESIKTEMN